MSSFNMENQMSYVSDMTEEEKITFLKVLVALSCSDNNFDDEEKAFIQDIALVFGIKKDKINDIFAGFITDYFEVGFRKMNLVFKNNLFFFKIRQDFWGIKSIYSASALCTAKSTDILRHFLQKSHACFVSSPSHVRR